MLPRPPLRYLGSWLQSNYFNLAAGTALDATWNNFFNALRPAVLLWDNVGVWWEGATGVTSSSWPSFFKFNDELGRAVKVARLADSSGVMLGYMLQNAGQMQRVIGLDAVFQQYQGQIIAAMKTATGGRKPDFICLTTEFSRTNAGTLTGAQSEITALANWAQSTMGKDFAYNNVGSGPLTNITGLVDWILQTYPWILLTNWPKPDRVGVDNFSDVQFGEGNPLKFGVDFGIMDDDIATWWSTPSLGTNVNRVYSYAKNSGRIGVININYRESLNATVFPAFRDAAAVNGFLLGGGMLPPAPVTVDMVFSAKDSVTKTAISNIAVTIAGVTKIGMTVMFTLNIGEIYNVAVAAVGYQSLTAVSVPTLTNTSQTFLLDRVVVAPSPPPPSGITGDVVAFVKLNGAPFAGATVNGKITAADGKASFQGLPEGPFTLNVAVLGLTGQSRTVQVVGGTLTLTTFEFGTTTLPPSGALLVGLLFLLGNK